jgi:hypothetical protein
MDTTAMEMITFLFPEVPEIRDDTAFDSTYFITRLKVWVVFKEGLPLSDTLTVKVFILVDFASYGLFRYIFPDVLPIVKMSSSFPVTSSK